jgi:hypothetical protein
MFKTAFLSLSLTVSSFAIAAPAAAQADAVKTAPAPLDPARLKLAEQTVIKLIPPGTYSKIMKDMMDSMAGGIVEQMMGMDAAMMAGMAGEEAGSEAAEAAKGKTMGDLVGEKDPAFKERMDITMKVMFSEMGILMSDMEPVVREALSKIYARKYTARELTDMNTFFATPSGASFAGNFMATFTDKEMMEASFGMMPKMMEAMPEIIKKVEAATAHLPPLPKSAEATESAWPDCAVDGDESDCSDDDKALAAAVTTAIADEPDPLGEIAAGETADDPWYDQEKWTPADKKKVESLGSKYDALVEKSDAAFNKSDAAFRAWKDARGAAINAARTRYKAEDWQPPIPTDGPAKPADT